MSVIPEWYTIDSFVATWSSSRVNVESWLSEWKGKPFSELSRPDSFMYNECSHTRMLEAWLKKLDELIKEEGPAALLHPYRYIRECKRYYEHRKANPNDN